MQILPLPKWLKSLGENEIADRYYTQSLNYKKLFDPSTKLMRGKNEDGSFQTPFNPLKWGDAFTEGNSLHYTWSVFHDIQGLIDLMGGKEAFHSAAGYMYLKCLLILMIPTTDKPFTRSGKCRL